MQPVLLHSTFFAKEKGCDREGFCLKAVSCNAKKKLISEKQDINEKSCHAKKELVSEKKSCSSKKAPASGKDDSEKGCTKKDCGPFTICSYCCIIPMDRPVFSFSYFVEKAEKARLINENISSNYISDLWHPPEFV
ncbi:hypothetical protein D0T08_04835 [Emticicia sp. C21]|nr:hypothetical protein D0T08_04835 [Emticicia sp. C21]